jgi:hypothetical protein
MESSRGAAAAHDDELGVLEEKQESPERSACWHVDREVADLLRMVVVDG